MLNIVVKNEDDNNQSLNFENKQTENQNHHQAPTDHKPVEIQDNHIQSEVKVELHETHHD